jgi:hypothetical protein
MRSNQMLRIHPSFRIIAVGNPPERENPWLVAEVLGIFSFVDTLSVASLEDKISIVSHISPPRSALESDLLSLLQNACHNLETLAGGETSSSVNNIAPSCRQLLRLWRSSQSNINRSLTQYTMSAHGPWKDQIISDVNDKLLRMFMVPFMPPSLRDSFQASLTSHAAAMSEDAQLLPPGSAEVCAAALLEEEVALRAVKGAGGGGDTVQIGRNVLSLVPPLHPELVPDTRFVSIQKHMTYLESIADDVIADERHVLLIGNQGKVLHNVIIIGLTIYVFELFCDGLFLL